MAYKFQVPTTEEAPAGFSRLFWRYRLPRADSLLVNGTVVTRLRTPAVDDTISADYCYLGGHIYYITQTEVDILTAAGYGPYITIV